VICVIVEEISNPCILGRKIMRAKGKEDSVAYKVIETCFAVLFIVFRTVFATIAMHNTWQTDMGFIVFINQSLVHGIGVFWVFVVICMILRRFKGEQKQENGFFIRNLIRGTDWLKKRNYIIFTVILFWSVLIPYYLTSVAKIGYINLKIGNFIVI
jgi:hypothetical protein